MRDSLFPVNGINNKIILKGNIVKLQRQIQGNNNVVEIKGTSKISQCIVRICGNGNHLLIEEGCIIGKGCSFRLEGNNNEIIIGKKTTMTQRCHFIAQEHDTKIIVGEDCMFSNTIIVRTSDSHPIYDSEGERLNPAKDVIIGKHVWIAPNSVVMKGSIIGENCIIGSHTLVNKPIKPSCLAVGIPVKVIREEVVWSRENVLK